MKCFAYIRVSTTKQRDQGASLEAQQDAIERYARQQGLEITRWFRETKTAASRGRGVFANLIRLLKAGEAEGAIVHRIDRSARNLHDWSDFISLIDHGVAIHIAGENLDLTSRGGRLSADIQAVVAADYVRNLKIEAHKGIRARYKQGFLPSRAPLGYRNQGSGKVKTIDPKTGPLIRELFERYSTGGYSLDSIRKTMGKLGLRNLRGRSLSINSVSAILNNPFYYGLLRIKATGETFEGKHEPLISKRLFRACEAVREGRTKHRAVRSRFSYSRLIRCAACSYSLVAEEQKGHIYYRCHTKSCLLKSKREEEISEAVERQLIAFSIDEETRQEVEAAVRDILSESGGKARARAESEVLQLKEAEARLEKLTDLILDGVIDESTFRAKQQVLQNRALELRRRLDAPQDAERDLEAAIKDHLELAETALLSYQKGNEYQKRKIVKAVTSNLSATPKEVVVELLSPFQTLASIGEGACGGEQRDEARSDSKLPSRHRRLAERLIQDAEENIGNHSSSKS